VRPLIDKSFEGFNATIFAYGHTGAGKTFTTFGDSKRGVKGLLHHVTENVFLKLQQKCKEWMVGCNFVEIYNE
jgi:hypothetical protein